MVTSLGQRPDEGELRGRSVPARRDAPGVRREWGALEAERRGRLSPRVPSLCPTRREEGGGKRSGESSEATAITAITSGSSNGAARSATAVTRCRGGTQGRGGGGEPGGGEDREGGEVWGCGTPQLGGHSSAVCLMLMVVGAISTSVPSLCSGWALCPRHPPTPSRSPARCHHPQDSSISIWDRSPPIAVPFGVGAVLGPAWPAVTGPPGSPDPLT